VGSDNGDGMEGAGGARFEIFDISGVLVASENDENVQFNMMWNTMAVDTDSQPIFPNGMYTFKATAVSDAGYEVIEEISVTVNNP